MTVMERCMSIMKPVTTVMDHCVVMLKNIRRRSYTVDRWCADYDFDGKCQSCDKDGIPYDGDPVSNMACDDCKVKWNHNPEFWKTQGVKNDKE